MKLAIMQPYIFPYLGYFQLIKAVDSFIIADDFQYIEQGWINRNRILVGGQPYRFTFSVRKDAYDRPINERYFAGTFKVEKRKFLATLSSAYGKAPLFREVFPLIKGVLENNELNVSAVAVEGLKTVCRYLDIGTRFYLSSGIPRDESLKKEHKVLDLNLRMGATHYINAIGGAELYSKEFFAERGVRLDFIKTRPYGYRQFDNEFVPDLSIIDVMMFNSKERVKQMLKEYDLV